MKVGIVGSGIVGLAYAWSAAERGHQVTVFDRTARASGASIRNFGMVWPIGQPSGELYQTALVSRDRWLQLGSSAGITVNPCGSIHLAHRDDEFAVIEEFASLARDSGYQVRLLSAKEVLQRAPLVSPTGLRGGLLSETELGVNPRVAIRALPSWLCERWGVTFLMNTSVVQANTHELLTGCGAKHSFDQIIVCSGDDFVTLFPGVHRAAGLVLCKLQMLKTQATSQRLGAHLASGLTLRHYHNFAVCGSLKALRQRIAEETPELDRFGIHVMASQLESGELILGDSHEYDDAIEPFDQALIDELMLRELRRIMRLEETAIVERWHGTYAKHPELPIVALEPKPGVFIRTGTGGAGMTMSFGLAEQDWEKWN